MQRNRATELKVGMFVMVALVLAGMLAFMIGSKSNLFRSKTHYHAVFEHVGGLRTGSPVYIAGVSVGTVDSVDLGEDGRIHVELGIVSDAAPLVRVDSVCTIGNKGLLGDKLLDITVGEGEPLPEGGTIPTEAPVELSAYLARAGTIIESVEGTARNLEQATAPLADEQFQEDLSATMQNLAELSRMAAEEDGTVRRLFTDPRLADDVQATLHNARTTTSELAQTARSARLVMDEIRTGDGGAHALIYGEDGARLVTNLADVSGEAATLMRDVRTGDGLVHDIVYEDTGQELMDNVTAISADARAIMSDIRAGRGTIGGLLVDPSIYEDVKRLVGNLERNDILRALVRYSIRNDESQGTIDVGDVESQNAESPNVESQSASPGGE